VTKITENQIEIYQTADGQTQINIRFEQETVWLNRQQLAMLFDRDVKTIGKHVNNVFKEGELKKDAVAAKFATTAQDGKTYQVDHYNLDVVISVGYRVKSLQGTQFRIWATARLKELLLQGYSLHQQRFEQNFWFPRSCVVTHIEQGNIHAVEHGTFSLSSVDTRGRG